MLIFQNYNKIPNVDKTKDLNYKVKIVMLIYLYYNKIIYLHASCNQQAAIFAHVNIPKESLPCRVRIWHLPKFYGLPFPTTDLKFIT